jgi:DNA-directed RNA polymerase subunit RPC12/RpoP
MNRRPDFDLPPEPGEEADEAAVERGGSKELYGESRVKPSLYHCAHCNKDILSQDVVWDRSDRPRCPECNSPLERQ